MKHEEIYNNIRTTVGILLLTVMFMTPSCEDNVVEEQVSLEPVSYTHLTLPTKA